MKALISRNPFLQHNYKSLSIIHDQFCYGFTTLEIYTSNDMQYHNTQTSSPRTKGTDQKYETKPDAGMQINNPKKISSNIQHDANTDEKKENVSSIRSNQYHRKMRQSSHFPHYNNDDVIDNVVDGIEEENFKQDDIPSNNRNEPQHQDQYHHHIYNSMTNRSSPSPAEVFHSRQQQESLLQDIDKQSHPVVPTGTVMSELQKFITHPSTTLIPKSLHLESLKNAFSPPSATLQTPSSTTIVSTPASSRVLTARNVLDKIATIHDSNVHRQNRINEASMHLHKMHMTLSHAQHLKTMALSNSVSSIERDIAAGQIIVYNMGQSLHEHENALQLMEENVRQVSEETSLATTSIKQLTDTVSEQRETFEAALLHCDQQLSKQQAMLLRQDKALQVLTNVRARLDLFIDGVLLLGTYFTVQSLPIRFLSKKLASLSMSGLFPSSMKHWPKNIRTKNVKIASSFIHIGFFIGFFLWYQNIAQRNGLHHNIGKPSLYMQWITSSAHRWLGVPDISHYFVYNDEEYEQNLRVKEEIEKKKERQHAKEKQIELERYYSQFNENSDDDRQKNVSKIQKVKTTVQNIPKNIQLLWEQLCEKYTKVGALGLIASSGKISFQLFVKLLRYVLNTCENTLVKLVSDPDVNETQEQEQEQEQTHAQAQISTQTQAQVPSQQTYYHHDVDQNSNDHNHETQSSMYHQTNAEVQNMPGEQRHLTNSSKIKFIDKNHDD